MGCHIINLDTTEIRFLSVFFIGDRSKWLITTLSAIQNNGNTVDDSNPRSITLSSSNPTAAGNKIILFYLFRYTIVLHYTVTLSLSINVCQVFDSTFI